MRSALVIGGGGLIGSALSNALSQLGIHVMLTSRRNTPPEIFLDLVSVPLNLERLPKIDVVYLCAAISRFEDCERFPLLARRVNVTAQVELARHFFLQGARVIFLSTNAVFDGRHEAPVEDQLVNPGSLYGELKSDAERELRDLAKQYAGALVICRFTKVFGANSPLIVDWIKKTKDHHRVEAFSDMKISPVSLRFAVEGLIRCGISKYTGILHFSGQEEFSYFYFASALARTYGGSDGYIYPAQSGKPKRHNKLSMKITEQIIGMRAQSLNSLLEDLIS